MKQFGLIGFPLGHSFSRKYFSEKFEREGINASYSLYELKSISEITSLLDNKNLSGLNVTIPYKVDVIKYLEELDDTALKIGAANTIKFIRTGGKLILKGYNTDVIGFENSIKPLLLPIHRKALILGTGGASKAIDYALRNNGIETTFVTRTPKVGMYTYKQLTNEIISENLVIINASPVGTFPHSDECPDIPYEFLTEKHILFDVVYNPAETLFMKKGKIQGAQTMNGEQMLIGQAVASWKIWNTDEVLNL